MPNESEINRLLNDLTRATASGGLSWELLSAPASLSAGTDDLFPTYLQTGYKSQIIGLYEKRFQSYFPDLDNFLWDARIGLIFLDRQSRITWQYDEKSGALGNLFEIAKESATGIDDIFANLLSDS